MTLNGHFALKSGPSSASNGFKVGVLAFGENCSEICRATHRLSAPKNVAQLVLYVKCSPACTGDIRVMELFTGITEQEASNQ